MTAKELNNGFNNENTQYRTRMTLVIDVPLSVDDIRRMVHLWDAEMSSPEDAIEPQHVSPSDFISMWQLGEYTGDVLIQSEEFEVLS